MGALRGVSAPKGSNPNQVGHLNIMEHAAAMKYGGELVAAVDCTYDSFKELVPLCPECKEPVFLRAGGDRLSTKGKAHKIGPHWCHFRGISAEQVASCESRVNSYTEKDKQRIAAKARGQRLKLLQRWFWTVAVENACLNGEAGMESLETQLTHPCNYIEIPEWGIDKIAETLRKDIQGKTASAIWDIADNSEIGKIGYSPDFDDDPDCDLNDPDFYLDDYEVYTYSPRHINATNPLNQKIAIEVLSFLSSKSSRNILDRVVTAIAHALDSYASMCQFGRDERDAYSSEFYEALIFWIFGIPWASEFQRLEAESQQRKAAV